MTKKISPLDTGTKERGQHNRLVPELTGHGYEFRVRVKDHSEMDRLLMEEIISADEYQIIERFAADLYKAGYVGIRASNLEPSTRGHSENMSENLALAKLTINQAMKKLNAQAGDLARIVLVRVALDESELNPEHEPYLHKAIEVVGDFYG